MCNKFKNILIISTILFVFFLLFNFIMNMEHTLVTSYATDKSYKIIVKYNDPFPFGDTTVHVYYKKKYRFRKYKLFTTEISNKSMNLNSKNCSISWDNQNATITFSGVRGYPETYIVDISKTPKYRFLE